MGRIVSIFLLRSVGCGASVAARSGRKGAPQSKPTSKALEEKTVQDRDDLDQEQGQAREDDKKVAVRRIVVPIDAHFSAIRRKEKNAGWFVRIPKSVVLDLAGKPTAFQLYALLMTYIDVGDPLRGCYPSIGHLAEEMDWSESTVRRNLAVLKDRQLVRVEKRGRGNLYKLYSVVVTPRKSDSDTGQVCVEHPSEVDDVSALSDGGYAEPEELFDDAAERDIEVRTRPSKGEVQAGTSSLTRQGFKNIGIGRARASALIEKFGWKKVEEAIAYVRGQSNVRSPAALLVSYLENDGWTKLTKLKEYLPAMLDPATQREEEEIATHIVGIVGSKYEALKALEEVRADAKRLDENASCEEQRSIAGKLMGRAWEAMRFIREHVHTPEEQRENDEMDAVLRKLRHENGLVVMGEERPASSGAATEAPSE